MGALLPLFDQPFLDAISAAKLRAIGTQDSILNFPKANEALEDLIDLGVHSLLVFFAVVAAAWHILSWSAHDVVLLGKPPCVDALDGADIAKSIALRGAILVSLPIVVIGRGVDQVQWFCHRYHFIIIVHLILERIVVEPFLPVLIRSFLRSSQLRDSIQLLLQLVRGANAKSPQVQVGVTIFVFI